MRKFEIQKCNDTKMKKKTIMQKYKNATMQKYKNTKKTQNTKMQ